MAYNNGFPINYGQFYPQYQIQPTYTQQTTTPTPVSPAQQAQGGIIWVQGEAGAKSYLVAPNTTVQLWDSERQSIYLKSADASGMPSMKILDYTIREQAQAPAPVVAEQGPITVDYVTHQELKELEDKITHKIDGIKEDISA